MNAIVGTGKRGKTGVRALGIAGILCLAVAPVFGATAGAGVREGDQSPPPGAASLTEYLDEAVYSLPASQPTETAVEDVEVIWGTGSASKLLFVPAVVDAGYFNLDEGTVPDLSEQAVAGAQTVAVLASLVDGPDSPAGAQVLLARVDLDTAASSAGNGAVRIGWDSMSAPMQVLVRTMTKDVWSPWEPLRSAGEGEGTEILELEAIAAFEVLVVPAESQTETPWIELQTPVTPIANVLAELLPSAPVEPGGDEQLPESPEEEAPATDQDKTSEDEGTDSEETIGGEGGGEEETPATDNEDENDTQDENVLEEETAGNQVLGEAKEEPAIVSALVAPLSARALSTQVLSMANAITNWNPGFILSDATMYTPSRMTEAQIKTFIETVGKNCKSTGTNKCLKDQTVTNLSLKSDFASKGWGCKALSIPGTVPSWTAIKKVADACSINPEVLLVFIQKESSGLSQALSQSNWNKMMGVGCPDNQPCNTAYSGFTNQLYYSADWLGSYRYRGFYFNEAVKTGKPVVVNNSSTYGASCGTQTFVMQNQATASLYTYNPAVPTKTALESWPGVTGNKCDSYGQRNVYMMMLQWFPGSMQDLPGTGVVTPSSPVSWKAPVQIDSGLSGRVVFPGDWNGDGNPDLMRIDAVGDLYLIPGLPGERFGGQKKIGNGWGGMDWVQGGVDWDGDGNMDILARRRSDGTLWLYPGNGSGGFLRCRQIGHGWNAMSQLVLTETARGPAIYAVRALEGRMYAYLGDGKGSFLRTQTLGTGWNAMTALVAVGDWTGDGRPDMLARDKAGLLYLYQGTAEGMPGVRARVGNGWNIMSAIGVQTQQRAKAPVWAVRTSGELMSYGIR